MAKTQTADVYYNRQLRRWVARWRTVDGQVNVQYFLSKAEAENFARDTSSYTLARSQSVMFTRADVLNYRRHET